MDDPQWRYNSRLISLLESKHFTQFRFWHVYIKAQRETYVVQRAQIILYHHLKGGKRIVIEVVQKIKTKKKQRGGGKKIIMGQTAVIGALKKMTV